MKWQVYHKIINSCKLIPAPRSTGNRLIRFEIKYIWYCYWVILHVSVISCSPSFDTVKTSMVKINNEDKSNPYIVYSCICMYVVMVASDTKPQNFKCNQQYSFICTNILVLTWHTSFNNESCYHYIKPIFFLSKIEFY